MYLRPQPKFTRRRQNSFDTENLKNSEFFFNSNATGANSEKCSESANSFATTKTKSFLHKNKQQNSNIGARPNVSNTQFPRFADREPPPTMAQDPLLYHLPLMHTTTPQNPNPFYVKKPRKRYTPKSHRNPFVDTGLQKQIETILSGQPFPDPMLHHFLPQPEACYSPPQKKRKLSNDDQKLSGCYSPRIDYQPINDARKQTNITDYMKIDTLTNTNLIDPVQNNDDVKFIYLHTQHCPPSFSPETMTLKTNHSTPIHFSEKENNMVEDDNALVGEQSSKNSNDFPLPTTPPNSPSPLIELEKEPIERIEQFNLLVNKIGINTTLMDHQRQAVKWMIKKEGLDAEQRSQACGGILADDMGLGKTLTAICTILMGRYMDSDHKEKIFTPTLIVVPKTLLEPWREEIFLRTNVKLSRVLVYYDKERDTPDCAILKKTFVITSYETILTAYNKIVDSESGTILRPLGQRGILYNTKWDRVFLDEAQRIKNSKAKTAKAIYQLRANRRWCLTGTPFNNKKDDLASLCKFIGVLPYADPNWWLSYSEKDLLQWRNEYILRRTKKILNLPPVSKLELRVNLTHRELAFYEKILVDAEADYNDFLYASGTTKSKLFQELVVWLLRLRQSCNDPLLLLGRSTTIVFSTQTKASKETLCNVCANCDQMVKRKKKQTNSQDYRVLPCGHILCIKCAKVMTCTICKYKEDLNASEDNMDAEQAKVLIDDEWHTSSLFALLKPTTKPKQNKKPVYGYSSKTQTLLDYLRNTIEKEERPKFAIFSQWTSYLDLIENAIENEFPNVKYVRLDGDVHKIADRSTLIQQFKNNADTKIFMASIQAGGIGLNLVAANHVIIMDSWFNPFVEKQAIDRVHRIGQTRPVKVVKIIADISIEEAISNLGLAKKKSAKYFLCGTCDDKDSVGTGLNEREMRSIFKLLKEHKEQKILETQAQNNNDQLKRAGAPT